MLDVEDWAEIRRLSRAEGLSVKEIARRLGVARNTVSSALRSDSPPWRETKRLGRDHWVRIGTCDYSVHPDLVILLSLVL